MPGKFVIEFVDKLSLGPCCMCRVPASVELTRRGKVSLWCGPCFTNLQEDMKGIAYWQEDQDEC